MADASAPLSRQSSVLSPPSVLGPQPTAVRVRERRWVLVRRALSARFAPVGGLVVLVAVLVAVLAPVLSPYDPLQQDLANSLARPGGAHLLGTDNVGRDVLARVIFGTRVSLIAGAVSVAIAALVGSLLGLGAGYWGGRLDDVAMRLMDAVLSFPPLVLALALGAVLGAGLTGVLIALGVVYTPTFARLMRGPVLSVKARDYVDAARLASRAPQCRHCDRRSGLAQRGIRDPGRGLAVVSRARHPAARGVVGQHDQRRPRLPAAGAVDRLRAGRRAVHHRGRAKLRRRRRPRRPRPPRARLTPGWALRRRL